MIYLDNAATTKMDEMALRVYEKYALESFFNASAIYPGGHGNRKCLDEARDIIKQKLNVEKGDIVFTGSATESNNIAILGLVRNKPEKYIFSSGEHPSVYETAKYLISIGKSVYFVPLLKDGTVDLVALEKLLDENVRLISIMHVSNETGAVNNIKAISDLKQKYSKSAFLHIDGVQAFCKIIADLSNLHVDMYTISAHKFHGPKGVAALYIKDKTKLHPIIFGGGQEFSLRSGTENVPGIMAMADIIQRTSVDSNYQKTTELKKSFMQELQCDEVIPFETSGGSPYIQSLIFSGVNAETLLRVCGDRGVYISQGSACSASRAGNRILDAIGLSKEEIKSSIRVSFSCDQTKEEVLTAARIMKEEYSKLKEKLN